MSEQVLDEVGSVRGPQAAAQDALGVEIDGREPPPGAAPEEGIPPPDQGPDRETWRELLETGIGSLFAVCGSRWKSMQATPQEVSALADAWAPVCEKHMGGAIPIEYLAIGATLLVVGPKVIGAVGEHKAQKAAARQAASEARTRDPGTAHP